MRHKKNLILLAILFTVAILASACAFVPQNPTTKDTTATTGEDKYNPDVDAAPESITLTNAKMSFEFAEDFNSYDLVVTANMPDGTKKVLDSSEYYVDSKRYNSMKTGSYEITVTVKETEIFTTYEVSVEPANKLKVLMIGNSFADDAINYAYEIAKSSGIPEENILIADIYIGGCSLATHWENAQNDAAAYRFGLEKEGWFDGSSYTGWTMREAIKYADWDFITFQQNSGNSGGSASYACLQSLMNYVYDIATDEKNNPNANPNVKFAWHQTWAYQNGTTANAFSTWNYDQMTMYNAIQECLKLHVLNKNFAAIIPNGTAIQNARTSFIGDTFSRDQHNHLSYDAGRYIAAMGLVGTLTGRDMTAVEWKPTDSGFNYPMSNEMIEVCKESYLNASANFLEITPSKYKPESIYDVFEGSGTITDPYLIQNEDDMWKLSDLTKGQSLTDKSMYFKLTADLNLSAENWQPICSSAATGWVANANSFNANFDGNGKTITFIGNYTGDSWAKGLFSGIGGYVHDLTLKGSITMEKGRVGSLASMALTGARIENITSYVDITAGNNQAGGIIGYIASPDVTIINCVNYGTITARSLVGGIVGGSWQNVTYINCANHGDINATIDIVGGIVAEKYAAATLTGCTNDGTVTADGTIATTDTGVADKYAGNLVGKEY